MTFLTPSQALPGEEVIGTELTYDRDLNLIYRSQYNEEYEANLEYKNQMSIVYKEVFQYNDAYMAKIIAEFETNQYSIDIFNGEFNIYTGPEYSKIYSTLIPIGGNYSMEYQYPEFMHLIGNNLYATIGPIFSFGDVISNQNYGGYSISYYVIDPASIISAIAEVINAIIIFTGFDEPDIVQSLDVTGLELVYKVSGTLQDRYHILGPASTNSLLTIDGGVEVVYNEDGYLEYYLESYSISYLSDYIVEYSKELDLKGRWDDYTIYIAVAVPVILIGTFVYLQKKYEVIG